ncbi:malignant fibrous histiocytoma-amplified sequence 1 homolog [Watersipora subatra]|uniref:malignant fibrous histiocytoma-amplified sequence 1 homolog n=1 Tax=Watersipora subatra TaxID=2589382 RepID=UPI00355BBCD3
MDAEDLDRTLTGEEKVCQMATISSLPRSRFETVVTNGEGECCRILKSLKRLKVLTLDFNNFSAGLPPVIGEIGTLEILLLRNCQLTDLPQSLSSLKRLKKLTLHENNFSKGLPSVIGEIGTLENLRLMKCQLRDLPQRLHYLTQLRYLNLSENFLVELPSVVYRMTNLKKLGLSDNKKLTRINSQFAKLQQLTKLYCDRCFSLQSPPYEVCIQGIAAVNKYFADLVEGKGVEQLKVPVAVVGMTGAGKSSLIRSLQSGKRELTYREKNSPFDETTKVFQMEDLNNSPLKFIDYGGHDIYQMAYQLVIRERCIPLLVVNMEEFNSYMFAGSREGARRLCIDWLSHIYLASPRLDPPVLVLTHTDKLDTELVEDCREKLLSISEAARRELLRDYERCCGEFQKDFSPIIYLTNTDEPLFNPQDIFEFGNDLGEVSNIKGLRANLEKRCEKLIMEIPLLWERVEKFIKREEGTYIPLLKVENEFSDTDFKIILRYMHNTGQVLWFERTQGLSSYIFHKIPIITEMIALLFHHTAEQQWEKRVEELVPFTHQEEWVSKRKYQAFVAQFTTSGIIDEVLLVDLLKNSSELPVEISMQLLKSFAILNGPIEDNSKRRSYILPYFTTTSVEKIFAVDDNVPLRLDIALGGLSPPPYVYQLMTVAVLKLRSSLLSNIKVWNDGAVVHSEEFTTILNHDLTNRVVSLRVGTTVAQLPASWEHLIVTTKAILNQLYAVWKGSHTEVLLYCSQCLIGQNPAPHFYVDPEWFYPIDCDYSITCTRLPTTRSHLSKVVCPSCDKLRNDKKPSVPKPLRFPCDQLTVVDVQSLENHLSEIRESCPPQTVGHLESTSEEAESDLSDVEDQGYCDESKADKVMRLRLCIVKKPKIKQLYQSNKTCDS